MSWDMKIKEEWNRDSQKLKLLWENSKLLSKKYPAILIVYSHRINNINQAYLDQLIKN